MPNYASAKEHVPEAERNNRTIKERIRATFHTQPFSAIPKIMIKALVMESTRKLNFFPPKGGISSYYSLRDILHSEKLDYNRQCHIPPFSHVMAHDEPQPSNTNQARVIDLIYLRPLANAQGGHEVLNLLTGGIITRCNVTIIPMTPSIIKAIEDWAQRTV